jgi:hydroxybutyrate-dimer hydrolase
VRERATPEKSLSIDFLCSAVRETAHRGRDDLLSGGLGLAGLRGTTSIFSDPAAPTPPELRRRAIQANWKGIADLGPLGGYGEVYGGVPDVPGREYQAFAKIPGARPPHRVLVQIPDAFDAQARCLVVTASSGSRGIYGAIALAGAWGLAHGCAVAYTDKGAGTGYFDTSSATGVTLDGTRAAAGAAELEFTPDVYMADSGIAVKHAHSADNPEADWGRHLLQAVEFGLAMLDRALPQHAPFTPQNTRIIAVGLSNGAAAVLQAAGLDTAGWLDAAIAIAPNVNVPGRGRVLYDYATEAALLLPCALTDVRFNGIPFARAQGAVLPTWAARGANLRDAGISASNDAQALDCLHAGGWNEESIASAAATTALELWRAFGATYASAYTRSAVGGMPSGYRFATHDTAGRIRPATPAERATWWADAVGIPPGVGIFLDEPPAGDPADPSLAGLLQLRALWTSGTVDAQRLRTSIAATAVNLPRAELPLWIIHGRDDGLIPAVFSSDAYVRWLRDNGREPIHWALAHAQHFDGFLALPGFGDRYVPLLPYAYAALDGVWRHLVAGEPLQPRAAPAPQPRGAGKLDATHLGLR